MEGGDGLSPLGSSFKGRKQRKSKFLAGNNFEFDRTRRIFVILSTFQALRKEGSLVSSLSLCNIFLDVSFVEKKTFIGLKTNDDLISRTTMLITSWLVLLPYRMSGYLDWAGFKTSWSNYFDLFLSRPRFGMEDCLSLQVWPVDDLLIISRYESQCLATPCRRTGTGFHCLDIRAFGKISV